MYYIFVASVVSAARCTHALVCLHRPHCHYACMATWIVYRELNRTSIWPPVLNLLRGQDCSDSTDAPHGAPRRSGSTRSSGMLFLHQERPVWFKTFLFVQWVQWAMCQAHILPWLYFSFFLLSYIILSLLIHTRAHTSQLLNQPGFKLFKL